MTILTKFLFDSAEKSPNQDVHSAYHSFGCWWNCSLNRCFNEKLKQFYRRIYILSQSEPSIRTPELSQFVFEFRHMYLFLINLQTIFRVSGLFWQSHSRNKEYEKNITPDIIEPGNLNLQLLSNQISISTHHSNGLLYPSVYN